MNQTQGHSLLEVLMGAARSFEGLSYPVIDVEPAEVGAGYTAADWDALPLHLLPESAGREDFNTHLRTFAAVTFPAHVLKHSGTKLEAIDVDNWLDPEATWHTHAVFDY